jgi:hypothetical protein
MKKQNLKFHEHKRSISVPFYVAAWSAMRATFVRIQQGKYLL